MEVPSIETNATGLAEFRPTLNEDKVAYSLSVTDIDQVTMAHIHQGKEGENACCSNAHTFQNPDAYWSSEWIISAR